MKYFLSIFTILFCTVVYSQNIKILDDETGKPIDNVTIFNTSKSYNTVSDSKGLANINRFKRNETLLFSHINYANLQLTKKIIIENNNIVYLSKNSQELDEVVLSVLKSKTKIKRTPEQIAVVSNKQIEQISPQTSADLLATIPGIRVQKSQFGGGSPVLRGMESNRVLLVVDGVRMNNAIYRKGHLQNSITVSPNILDRTEVVFGPSSVIYGSDALGGVIHYFTKTPRIAEKTTLKTSLFSRYSSVNNEKTGNISAELRFPKWASLTNVSYSNFGDLKMGENRSHGFNDWGLVNLFDASSATIFEKNATQNDDPSIQKNTGYSQFDLLQKFYIPISLSTDLKINIQYSSTSNIPRFDKLTEMKANNLKFAEWNYGPQNRFLISSQLDILPHKKWIDKGTFTVSYQNIEESRIQRKFKSINRSHREENLDIYSINGDFAITSGTNSNLSYGFEVVLNDVQSKAYGKKLEITDNKITGYLDTYKVQSRYPDNGSQSLSSAVYVAYRKNLTPKATLNAGIRFTDTYLSAKWKDSTFVKLPKSHITANHTSITATAGYAYKPNKEWQINTVLSTGFRAPNLDDIGKVREKKGIVTVPNIHLKPEHAYNAEIGIQKYFNHKKFRIGANVYYTLLNNYIYRERFKFSDNSSRILYEGNLLPIVANVNKGRAYITGFTTSYQGKLTEKLVTSGSVTYTQGEMYDTGEKMSSIPPLFGNFNLIYQYKKVEAGINFHFNAKKGIDDYNLSEGIDNQDQTPIINKNASNDKEKYYGTPSWSTFGIYMSYQITDKFKLQTRVDNILDKHYKEFASGVSAPGRNLSIDLHYNF